MSEDRLLESGEVKLTQKFDVHGISGWLHWDGESMVIRLNDVLDGAIVTLAPGTEIQVVLHDPKKKLERRVYSNGSALIGPREDERSL